MDGPIEESAAFRKVIIEARRQAREQGITVAQVWQNLADYCQRRLETRRRWRLEHPGEEPGYDDITPND